MIPFYFNRFYAMMIINYVFLFLWLIHISHSIIPTGELRVKRTNQVIYTAPASFGSSLGKEPEAIYKRVFQLAGDTKDGCYKPYVSSKNAQGTSYYLMIARGNCSFDTKAMAAQSIGAVGAIIYNSLEGIYQGRNYALPSDYECSNGMGYIPKVITPVYSSAMDDLMPDTCTKSSLCDSGKCVLTNVTSENGHEVCCAWDLYMSMGSTSSSSSSIKIPVVFIRMRDVDTLLSDPELGKGNMEIAIFSRTTYAVDVATVLLWLLALFTITYGSTRAAEEDRLLYHRDKPSRSSKTDRSSNTGIVNSNKNKTKNSNKKKKSSIPDYQIYKSIATEEGTLISARQNHRIEDNDSQDENKNNSSNRDHEHEHEDDEENTMETAPILPDAELPYYPQSNRRDSIDSNSTDNSKSFPKDQQKNKQKQGEIKEDSIDITPKHAIGFILISSTFLTILYFIDLYAIVIIVYLFAAAIACSLVYFGPFFRMAREKCVVLYSDDDDIYRRNHVTITISDIEDWIPYDWPSLLAACFSIWLAVTWYIYSDSDWAWTLQDIMGVAVCVVFLSAVRIPNLKVATILLSLAFLYDVFFVFISPFVFKSSVMLKVVSGNSSDISDENYCEKYPSSDVCKTEALPMLLVMPTFSSYMSSESMLGLGDIVLPGLLLAWAARYDVRRFGTLQSERAQKGYFVMCLIGYGFGLILANIAVSFFETGQPALFYIVPLTLGPTLYRSLKSETLKDLWEKLPPMNTVALPLGHDEQRALLSRPDVIEAVASWDYKDGVVVLDRIETAMAYSPYQLTDPISQNSGNSNGKKTKAIINPNLDEYGLDRRPI